MGAKRLGDLESEPFTSSKGWLEGNEQKLLRERLFRNVSDHIGMSQTATIHIGSFSENV